MLPPAAAAQPSPLHCSGTGYVKPPTTVLPALPLGSTTLDGVTHHVKEPSASASSPGWTPRRRLRLSWLAGWLFAGPILGVDHDGRLRPRYSTCVCVGVIQHCVSCLRNPLPSGILTPFGSMAKFPGTTSWGVRSTGAACVCPGTSWSQFQNVSV